MADIRPIIGITMGDPAGIGPEIIAKALKEKMVYEMCRPLVIGDGSVMDKAVQIINAELDVKNVVDVSDARFTYGCIDVLDLKNVNIASLEYGRVSAQAGKAAFEAIKKAIELAMAGQIDATVTAPINKEAVNLAGYSFAGHTEIYAHFTNTKDYAMMLVHGNLRIIHVSTHVSLRQACDLVKREKVFKSIMLADQACKSFGIVVPRIGVAGLNPHAGEDGLFGHEEQTEIIPAVEEARAYGVDVYGPISADALFPAAIGGQYDAVVAMYHDQGHIPLKVKGFHWNEKTGKWDSVAGVNITLGLPIIRTSVDHGTAFDQAGKGTASAQSLMDAIEYAVKLALNR